MKDTYEKIAKYYDKVGWADFAGEFYIILNKILYKKNIIIDSLLDLACGTGEFLKLCKKYDSQELYVAGLDLSEGMIKEARKKLKKYDVDLYVGDMCKIEITKKFDCITCLFDSVNHLANLSQFIEMLKSVKEHLNEGGVFIFDMIPLESASRWTGRDILSVKKNKLVRNIIFNNVKHELISYLEVYKKDKKVLSDSLTETVYDTSEIINLMKDQNFKDISIYNDKGNIIKKIKNNDRVIIYTRI